jgi:ubiquinone/menaquinone biosynthesis C-methylase UbiE
MTGKTDVTRQNQYFNQIRKDIINDPFFSEALLFVLAQFGNVKEKVILDSGCGAGKTAVFFALQGAKVIGIDINNAQITRARRLACTVGVETSCVFVQGRSESIGLASNSIDIIFSKSTIQYMERNSVIGEYIRILKPDGCIGLIENLPYNPVITLYRILRRIFSNTPQKKHYIKSIRGYITLNNIEFLAKRFRYSEHHEYHLLRPVSIYLRLYSRCNSAAGMVDNLLSRVDKQLLRLAPSLKSFAWFTAIYCKEKE